MTNTVRLALASEAAAIAAIQRRGWQHKYPTQILEIINTQVNLDQMTQAWATAISAPPLAQQRVLVAQGSTAVVGFAVVGPSPDPDAEPEVGLIAEFWVDQMATRQGHGSRLMQAAVDTMRADGFTSAHWWLLSTDDALRAFAESCGWDADGAHREIGLSETATVKQIRLSVAF